MSTMSFGATDVDGMLNSYLEYLWNGHPENATRFELLRESDREAAVAEAIVFGMLQTMGLRPETHDQVGTGGPDFICCGSRGPLFSRSLRDRLVVEATSLNPDAVTERSHIPNEVPDEISGGAFGLVTSHIRNKAKRKASQLGGYEMPRVLAIVSSHLVRSRAPCNGRLQTPPGPEGSNGSGAVRVPRITRGLA
jgi:hypothetical protein